MCSSIGARDPAHSRSCANVCRMSKSRQRPPCSSSYVSTRLSSRPAFKPATRGQTKRLSFQTLTFYLQSSFMPCILILPKETGEAIAGFTHLSHITRDPQQWELGAGARGSGQRSLLPWGRSAPGYLWALGHPGELLGRCPRGQMVTLNLWGPLPGLPAKACPNWGPSYEEGHWVGAGYMAETPQCTVLPWTLCQKTENR